MRTKRRINSSAAPVSSGSIKDNKQSDVVNENPVKKSNDEPVQEVRVKIEPQSSDDEEPEEEEDDEEPEEEEAEDQSSDSQYDPSEAEDMSEEEEEPTEEAIAEPSHPHSANGYAKNVNLVKVKEEKSCDTINNEVRNQLEFVSNEKQRLVSANDINDQLPVQSLGPESNSVSASTPLNTAEISRDCSNTENASKQQEQSDSSRKQRRSRWDTNTECEATSAQQEQPGSSGKQKLSRCDLLLVPKCEPQGAESENTSKRRKTRWAADECALSTIELPDFVKKLLEADWDPEIQELKSRLLENERLLEEVHDVNIQANLVRDRQNIIVRLLEKISPSKSDKSKKFSKKLYIPEKEYPNYNFVGLIIGPLGLTQKRMMNETGASILLRGKGSQKRTKNPEPTDEDLHVLIEADDQKSLDDAVGRVEKLLIPVDDRANAHKHAQLKEIAELKLSKRKCYTCGETDHMSISCPNRSLAVSELFSNPTSVCDKCGGRGHSTAICPLKIPTQDSNLDNQPEKGFLGNREGAGVFNFSTPQTSSHVPWQGSSTAVGVSPANDSNSHSGPGTAPIVADKSSKAVGDGRLFVRGLPPSVDDARLRELFAVFGKIFVASVIKDGSTGFSTGNGLVRYADPLNAAVAVVHMNGHMIEGKMLLVELGGKKSTDVPSTSGNSSVGVSVSAPVPSSTGSLSAYQGSPMLSQNSLTPTAGPRPRPPVSAPVPSSTKPLSSFQTSPMVSQNSPSPTAWPRPQVSAPVSSSTSPLPLYQGSTAWPRPPVSAPVPSSTRPVSLYQGSPMMSQNSPSPTARPHQPVSAPVSSSTRPVSFYQASPMMSQNSQSPTLRPHPPVSAPVGPHPPVSALVQPRQPVSAPVRPHPPVSAPVRPHPPVNALLRPHPPVSAPVRPHPPVNALLRPRPPVRPHPPVAAPVRPHPPVNALLRPRPPVAAPVPSSASLPPVYPNSATGSRYSPSTAAWLGPPGSMLPDPQAPSTKSNPVFSGHTNSPSQGLPSSHRVSKDSSISFAEFPGNPDRKSQNSSFLAPSSSVPPQSSSFLTPPSSAPPRPSSFLPPPYSAPPHSYHTQPPKHITAPYPWRPSYPP